MKNLFYHKSINQVNIISIVLAAFISVIFVLLTLYNLYDEYKKEVAIIEKNYFASQKEFIVNETQRALRYIKYKHDKDGQHKTLEALQTEIVDAIEQMRNERDGSGYIFIYTFDGINIADPILKQNAQKNLYGFTDPNGKKVIADLISVSQNENGGFVEYVWNKPIINKLEPKISYAVAYKPWKWMIGSGVYLDDIREVIQQKRREYNEKTFKYIIQILLITFALFFSAMLIYRYFTFLITKEISFIKESLQNVSSEYNTIESSKIHFKEFEEISSYINIMIEEIKEKNNSLEDLNKNLENKVEMKTKKLKTAKEFAEDLLLKQDKFIKNAIHEINTPLSIIITNIELYNMKYPKNHNLTKIEAGVKIIHNLYNDLSYMMKKDRTRYTKTKIDFSRFLKERVAFFEEVALGNKLFFNTAIEKKIEVFFNDVQLQRVCDNNISNAIKYSFENEVITVKLYQNREHTIFEITNIGNKIQAPQKLFERYYREDEARGGFGIGLNMVKEICEKSCVKTEVVSNDKQTTFRYYFKKVNHENTTS